MNPKGIMVSPGPGRPEDSGISLQAGSPRLILAHYEQTVRRYRALPNREASNCVECLRPQVRCEQAVGWNRASPRGVHLL